MAKAKRGDKFGCAECGLVVVVDEGCGCATADILCCGEPMVKGDIKTSTPAKKKASKKTAKPKKGAAAAKKPSAAKKKVAAKKPAAKKSKAKKPSAKAKKK